MAATANTTMQLAVPDGLRGRVMSVYTTIFAGSTPIGGPMMGGLASLFGIAVSLAHRRRAGGRAWASGRWSGSAGTASTAAHSARSSPRRGGPGTAVATTAFADGQRPR